MLYILETPLHFGLIIVSWVILLLTTLVGFYETSKKDKWMSTKWLNFLWGFFLFFAFSLLIVIMYHLPATATADQLFPYFLALWSCYALYAFFCAFYVLSTDYFQLPLWLHYLLLIGTISFLALLWFLTTPTTVFLVFDGTMNWLAMPLIIVAYGGILAIFYVFLLPFWLTYQINKQRTGAIKMGNWLIWFGGFLVDLGAIMLALVLFLAPYTLIALSLAALGMIIVLIGGIINFRAKPPTPST
jgi:hypothetical protein